jgi:hypothetical protein
VVTDYGGIFKTTFFEKDVIAENDGKHCERRFSVTMPMVRGRMCISFRYGLIKITESMSLAKTLFAFSVLYRLNYCFFSI